MSARYIPSRLIRVTLVDHDATYREMLACLVRATPGFELASTHASAEAALRSIPTTQPDVVVTELKQVRGKDGAEFTRELRLQIPDIRVVMLTDTDEPARVMEGLGSGAVGYLLKNEPMPNVLRALREAVDGGSPLSSSVARCLVSTLQMQMQCKSTPRSDGIGLLSGREMMLLTEAAKGASNKHLAHCFELSIETVRNHMRSIYSKLRVHSRTEAAAIFWSHVGHVPLRRILFTDAAA